MIACAPWRFPTGRCFYYSEKAHRRCRSQFPVGFIPPHDADGRQHLCWSITHDALEKWQSYLTAMGVVLETRLDWPKGASSLYFRDPDGHSLELGTSGLWENDPKPGVGGVNAVRRNAGQAPAIAPRNAGQDRRLGANQNGCIAFPPQSRRRP
jgi:hypothetical protein